MSDYLGGKIYAGTTFEKVIILAPYPADDWTLEVAMRGPSVIDITAMADGSNFRILSPKAETATWMDGRYWYQITVSTDEETHVIDEGHIDVIANLKTVSAGFDGRTHAERVLASIEAVIEGRATRDQEEYRINNRELKRTPIGDLLKLRSFYKDEIRRMKAAEKGQSLLGRKILTRF